MELKDLTTEVLSRFIGGQLEIQNQVEDYLYRGEIAEVGVEDDTLKVKFAWEAKMEDGQWVNQDDLNYELSLWLDRENNSPLCSVQDIGDNRLMIRPAAMFVSEILVFFPPDGNKLDPAKVVGLALAS